MAAMPSLFRCDGCQLGGSNRFDSIEASCAWLSLHIIFLPSRRWPGFARGAEVRRPLEAQLQLVTEVRRGAAEGPEGMPAAEGPGQASAPPRPLRPEAPAVRPGMAVSLLLSKRIARGATIQDPNAERPPAASTGNG